MPPWIGLKVAFGNHGDAGDIVVGAHEVVALERFDVEVEALIFLLDLSYAAGGNEGADLEFDVRGGFSEAP